MKEVFFDIPEDLQTKLAQRNLPWFIESGKLLHSECGGQINSTPIKLGFICLDCEKRWSIRDVKTAGVRKD